MNNKSITFFILWFFGLSSSSVFAFEPCNSVENQTICVNISVKDYTGQSLEGMVVYLEPLDGQILQQSSKEVIIGQLGKSFTPYISVSQVNSKINFTNQDDITHHIYSAGSDNKFSFKIRAGKTNSSTNFVKPSEVAMGCNIHDWMSGYLLIVDTPFFGKTNKLGQVSFAMNEKGKYKIVIWHPQMEEDSNRMISNEIINGNTEFTYTLKNKMSEIPKQQSDDDFDFLSDY